MSNQLNSPIGNLQPEILSEVFAYSVLIPCRKPSLDQEDIHERIQGALFLSGVCRYWRDLAYGTHELWAELAVESNYSMYGTRRRMYPRLDLVESWLERSASYSLDLTISWQSKPSVEDEERVVGIVLRNHGRLRALHLMSLFHDCQPLASSLLNALVQKGEMGRLQVLSVVVSRGIEFGLAEAIALPDAKKLLELRVEGGVAPRFPASAYINLRSISIVSPRSSPLHADPFLTVLDACSASLFFLELTTHGIRPPTSRSNRDAIILPALNSFHIIVYDNPAPFLECITLPALTCLHIAVLDGTCRVPLGLPPTGLLYRSNASNLEEIDWEMYSEVSEREIIDILHMSPALKKFSFDVPLTEELVRRLIISDLDPEEGTSKSQLVPCLEGMVWGKGIDCKAWNLPVFVDAFAKMVASRWGGGGGLHTRPRRASKKLEGALKSIRIDYVQYRARVAIDANPDLRECVQKGLDLVLVSS